MNAINGVSLGSEVGVISVFSFFVSQYRKPPGRGSPAAPYPARLGVNTNHSALFSMKPQLTHFTVIQCFHLQSPALHFVPVGGTWEYNYFSATSREVLQSQ